LKKAISLVFETISPKPTEITSSPGNDESLDHLPVMVATNQSALILDATTRGKCGVFSKDSLQLEPRNVDWPAEFSRVVDQLQNPPLDIPIDKLGCLEVYFEGILLFSKIQSTVWPNWTLVAKKVLRAYLSLLEGED
jgi:hypothetical protein